jgi:cytochrome b561
MILRNEDAMPHNRRSWKSDADRYGRIAVVMHWTTALAIVLMLASGFVAANTGDPMREAAIVRIHAVLGISVVLLTLMRLAWWAFADKKPPFPSDTALWQARLARGVHALLYAAILVLGGTGIGLLILSQAAPVLFFGQNTLLPEFTRFAPFAVHGLAARVLIGLLVLHVAGALYHQLILRDGLLARMGLPARPR